MPRKLWVGGNWKCNGTKESIKHLGTAFTDAKFDPATIDVAIFPTALHYTDARASLDKRFIVGTQNVSKTGSGAYTGEMSAMMIIDMGIEWTLVGHSERRIFYGETDENIREKVKLSLEAGLRVCLCIGETLEEREAGKTDAVCARQIEAVLPAVTDWSKIVIAYEPVWAIGTGKVATPEQAEETHAEIRKLIEKRVCEEVAKNLRIVYGGSVSDTNCESLIEMADIDGFLVGGASLKPTFVKIIECVAAR